MGEYLLETQGISKSFSTVKVLSDINLKIRKGEIHALLGENGAGKSMTMESELSIRNLIFFRI